MKRPIAVDLFAGAGGMTLGFERAGFDVPASVEIDPIHCATHQFNFPFWTAICADVAQLTGQTIREASKISGEIDVVFGGPPCQGFSMMGKRALDDPRNSLVFHFLRLVLELRPKYFVMENVPGLTIGKHRDFLGEIIDRFNRNGYSVREDYQVLNAADYGVPQERRRLFLLGARKGVPQPSYPKPVVRPATIGGQLSLTENHDLSSGPTVWDAIGDLPEIELYPALLERDWVAAEYGNPSHYASILRGRAAADNELGYGRLHDSRLLTSSLRTLHTEESVARFTATPQGQSEQISHFLRLHPDGLCNTLRAGTASNRGAFTSPRPIHPFVPRCITVREAARLHSYPDWFRFHATKWHGFRQVGNSVPPLLAQAVAGAIARLLEIHGKAELEERPLGPRLLLEMNMTAAAHLFRVDPRVIEPRKREKDLSNA